ncbi:hypothetical protein F2Q68_00021981 [Brassica cretica]|uniref:Uncharacterized protein n=1 Tax=Brassica cretica TaxID=69181 RepID=A0A8S9G0Q8_BRACR|nr:hypothetical protein F2Q68_00021981 [Brassica cretica]
MSCPSVHHLSSLSYLNKTDKRETTVRLQRTGFYSESGVLEVAIVLQDRETETKKRKSKEFHESIQQIRVWRNEEGKVESASIR